jgi:carbon-monoxide dehydrogenase medium subunit
MITSVLTPTTVDELTTVLNGDGILVAGATDVMPMYQAGLIEASRLIDITRIPELRRIALSDSGWLLGATASMSSILAVTGAPIAALSDAAGGVGSRQTRNRATIGGNVCRASPAGDLLAPLLACGGHVVAASENSGREIPAEDFFLGPGETCLREGEVVTGLRIPHAPGASAYCRATTRRGMDLAIVGVAVSIRLDDSHGARRSVSAIRVAVCGAGPTPVLVPMQDVGPRGLTVDDVPALLSEMSERVQAAIVPIDDVRASSWYRRRLVSVLLEEATLRAAERTVSDVANCEEDDS